LGRTCRSLASTIIWHSPAGCCLGWGGGGDSLSVLYSDAQQTKITHSLGSVTTGVLLSARTDVDLMCCVLPKGHILKCNGQNFILEGTKCNKLQFDWHCSDYCVYLKYCFG
jgi:hypothetical protein